MTDNTKGHVESRAFQAALISIGATHKRTRSYRAQTNGKAEAFIWTLQREWAYARPYSSNATRRLAPAHFVDTYNRRRPHTALGGLPPVSRVQTTWLAIMLAANVRKSKGLMKATIWVGLGLVFLPILLVPVSIAVGE